MPVLLSRKRSAEKPATSRAPRILSGAVLGFVIVRVAHMVIRARRVRLRSEWTRIPGIQRSTSLAVHARVSADIATSLPPVVLVHGYGIGSSYFVPLAARLRDDAHVYAPDLPGHGSSDHDVRPLNTRERAKALAAWMDANRLRAAVLVGHSAGAQIAAEVAARRPDLVSGLVLIAPASDPAARSVAGQVVRAARGLMFERPGLAFWAALDFARSGARMLSAELRELITHRIEDVLPRVTVPVRVVRGKWDQLVPQAWAESVARLANAPAPTVIGRWSHAVNYDDPDAVAEVVLELAVESNRRPNGETPRTPALARTRNRRQSATTIDS